MINLPLLVALLILAVGLGVAAVVVSRRRWAERTELRAAAPSSFGVQGVPAGAAADYLPTGHYWPTNYWAVYWPQYGEGVGGVRHGRLLGNELISAR